MGKSKLSLSDAIKHCEEVAEENDLASGTYKILAENNHNAYERSIAKTNSLRCAECASEHRQLAEWLKELKKLREFARDVAYSIIAEEEEFDENPRFFGEVYCRKLHKLGIIRSVDNKWVYGEEVTADGDNNQNS